MTTTGITAQRPVAFPRVWRVALVSAVMELRGFFREKDAVVFILSLPAVLLILLGSIFRGQAAAHGVSVGQLFAAGLIGGGIAATCFQNLGISIAVERDRGTLRLLSVTPMPRLAYFLGKAVLVVVSVIAETVLLVAVGVFIDHLRIPSSAERWWTLVWVILLGSVCCALLGVAASGLPRSARSASAVITMPFVVLQFISGVYVPFTFVPPWLRDIASFFPLKWICQGLQSVFLPAQAIRLEPAGSWEHGRVALVLGAWTVGGLMLCLTTFRWRNRRDA